MSASEPNNKQPSDTADESPAFWEDVVNETAADFDRQNPDEFGLSVASLGQPLAASPEIPEPLDDEGQREDAAADEPDNAPVQQIEVTAPDDEAPTEDIRAAEPPTRRQQSFMTNFAGEQLPEEEDDPDPLPLETRRTQETPAEDAPSREPAAFETLYNTNPGKFANMPTSEFMRIASELEDLRFAVEVAHGTLQRLDSYRSAVTKALERKDAAVLDRLDIAGLAATLMELSSADPDITDKEKDVLLRLQAASSSYDEFEDSVRSRLEKLQTALAILEPVCARALERKQHESDTYTDQFKPGTTAPQNED